MDKEYLVTNITFHSIKIADFELVKDTPYFLVTGMDNLLYLFKYDGV